LLDMQETFHGVERLARRARRSRSEVYSAALREYVARHEPDEVTEALNGVVTGVGEEPDARLEHDRPHPLAAVGVGDPLGPLGEPRDDQPGLLEHAQVAVRPSSRSPIRGTPAT